MAHYDLYESLGLDRTKDTATLAAELDERIRSGNTWNQAGIDELQVARAVLGNASRRSAYDHKLLNPNAPAITIDSLRRLANVDFDATPATAYSATKPYQYGPSTSQAPYEPAREEAPTPKKRRVWPWAVAAAVVLAGLGGGAWLLQSPASEWDEVHAEVAADFPDLVSETDGGKGYMGLTCSSRDTEGDEDVKIRCENSKMGLNIYRFDSTIRRDNVVGHGERELYGTGTCEFAAVEVPGQTHPTYYLAPEGDWGPYLLLLNGEDAEEMKTRLPIC